MPDALAIDVQGRNFVTDWSRWNYSGYERKTAYPEYRGIVTTMAAVGREHGCGRSLWEYSPDLNDYGTPMALMLLPHWTDGCIGSMEGLYFEASSTTPFHFLMQSELSKSPSRAQRDMPYRDLDVDAGVEHLQLMGVRYYLARSPEATAGRAGQSRPHRVAADGPWTVFEVADAPLVQPLRYEPAVTTTGGAQHEWLCSGEDAIGSLHRPRARLVPGSRRAGTVALAVDGPDDWQRVDPGQTARAAAGRTGCRRRRRASTTIASRSTSTSPARPCWSRRRTSRTGGPPAPRVRTAWPPTSWWWCPRRHRRRAPLRP